MNLVHDLRYNRDMDTTEKKYNYGHQWRALTDAIAEAKVALRKLEVAVEYEKRHAVDPGDDYQNLYGDMAELIGRIEDQKRAVEVLIDAQKQ